MLDFDWIISNKIKEKKYKTQKFRKCLELWKRFFFQFSLYKGGFAPALPTGGSNHICPGCFGIKTGSRILLVNVSESGLVFEFSMNIFMLWFWLKLLTCIFSWFSYFLSFFIYLEHGLFFCSKFLNFRDK